MVQGILSAYQVVGVWNCDCIVFPFVASCLPLCVLVCTRVYIYHLGLIPLSMRPKFWDLPVLWRTGIGGSSVFFSVEGVWVCGRWLEFADRSSSFEVSLTQSGP